MTSKTGIISKCIHVKKMYMCYMQYMLKLLGIFLA